VLNNEETAALKSAAHLVAALSDAETGIPADRMHLEVRDSLEILRGELAALGLLESYENGGRLHIW
jgi:hypothetical protein